MSTTTNTVFCDSDCSTNIWDHYLLRVYNLLPEIPDCLQTAFDPTPLDRLKALKSLFKKTIRGVFQRPFFVISCKWQPNSYTTAISIGVKIGKTLSTLQALFFSTFLLQTPVLLNYTICLKVDTDGVGVGKSVQSLHTVQNNIFASALQKLLPISKKMTPSSILWSATSVVKV